MRGQGVPGGSIIQIIPTVRGIDATVPTRAATLGEFFQALGAHPSEEFVRSLSSEFFFGVHFADVPSPVFVIPVTSYDHAFAGMLEWEKNINIELGGLFVQLSPFKPLPIPTATDTASTTATTTEQATQELAPPRTFEDLVMRNYDVRSLKDDNGAIVLYYSFPTQNLLVISASPYTFSEVLSRLQAARKL